MTLVELAVRSMRKNIKHYYLYFFALIFSTSLFFVFATLQHDASIEAEMGEGSSVFSQSFLAAGILLLLIVTVFTLYANSLFLNRRAKEIGIYQLIGLTKRGVARFLLIENVLLGAGALVLGIGCGALAYRMFLLLLIRLLGFQGLVSVKFSFSAVYQTAIVFAALIVLTSIQMLRMVYRNTLIDLFQAEKHNEHPSKPESFAAAILALLGIALVLFGYRHSGRMSENTLLLDSLAVLGSIIAGTYLLFRVTIGWLFYRVRRAANGHLGLTRALSLAPIMHRMKAQANSLTLITVLSAMTLTMVAAAYSFYFSAGKDTRSSLPFDFVIENDGTNARLFDEELAGQGIRFAHKRVEALQIRGAIRELPGRTLFDENTLLVMPAEQLLQAGAALDVPGLRDAVMYNGNAKLDYLSKDRQSTFPKTLELEQLPDGQGLRVTAMLNRFAMNYNVYGDQIVVAEPTFQALQAKLKALPGYGREQTKENPGYTAEAFDTFRVPDKAERIKASELYAKYVPEGSHAFDFETQYRARLRGFGLFIFIAGFLGLVFLIATGSILYFKQMTEAEQEKRSFVTLRQLGFEARDIMKGIARKQLFVFAIPLAIGISHAVFAVKTVSVLVPSSIVVPSAMAMGGYVLIYLIFVLLTIGYYKKIVHHAM